MKTLAISAIVTTVMYVGFTPAYADTTNTITQKVHKLFHSNKKVAMQNDLSQELSGVKQPGSNTLDYGTDNFIMGVSIN